MYFPFPELVVRHSNFFDFTEPSDLSEGLQSTIAANINLLKQTSCEITCVLRDSELDLISLFPLPLNKYEYKIFKKLSTVKEEVEKAKYSELIICP